MAIDGVGFVTWWKIMGGACVRAKPGLLLGWNVVFVEDALAERSRQKTMVEGVVYIKPSPKGLTSYSLRFLLPSHLASLLQFITFCFSEAAR